MFSPSAHTDVNVFIQQQSMVVPQTPLYTSQVLTEDKELWEDVKVRIVFTSESGHKMAVEHYLRFKAQTVSSNRRK